MTLVEQAVVGLFNYYACRHNYGQACRVRKNRGGANTYFFRQVKA